MELYSLKNSTSSTQERVKMKRTFKCILRGRREEKKVDK